MNTDSFLLANDQPDVSALIEAFQRCRPLMEGGVDWLDQVRDCNGPGDSPDGRKHGVKDDPDSKPFPWENASNCKPFTADDAINELTGRDLVAFWRAMVSKGAGQSDESSYAVALVEHLIFGPMMASLDKEVELSSQFRYGRGWCLLAPRWQLEFGLKRYELKLATIEEIQNNAQAQLAQLAQAGELARLPGDQLAQLSRLAELVTIILDPTQDEAAKVFLREWYDKYVAASLPEKLRDRAPKVKESLLNRVLAGLRSEKRLAVVPIPYVCRNELEIQALEPWREVCLPSEYTDAQELVFQLEYVTPLKLEARILSQDYPRSWVEEAKKQTQGFEWRNLPVRSQPHGVAGLLSGGAATAETLNSQDGQVRLVQLVHAVYVALDADGVPGVYCTTFHPEINSGVAKHELVEGLDGKLLYVDLVHEWRSRAITRSRSVQEMVATQQKLIKDTLDGIVDRAAITILPPVNTYESPTGANYAIAGPAIGDLEFGPGAQNRFRRKETAAEFMQLPSGSGMADSVEVYREVQKQVNNRFGLMSDDVPKDRMQILQEKSTRRFLIGWTRAFQLGLALWQRHGDDREFARITGAPEGWLESQRDVPGLLSSVLDFDARELDSEGFMEIVKIMDSEVLPLDSMNVIDRARYTAWKARGIAGPRATRQFMRSLPDANTVLREKAELQVLKMHAGTSPIMLDKDDPSAEGLLQKTRETVLANPRFVGALTPEALQAVAGEQLPLILAQMKESGVQPQPDPLFSMLLMKWIENLTFIGVTQQRNKQIGRQGVDGGQMNG